MRHSLQSHVIYLVNTIQSLKDRLTSPHLGVEELEDLELQLATAESALEHYRHAFALELSVGGSEPPSQPGGVNNGGDAGPAKDSKSEKKNRGLRSRKRARRGIAAFQILSTQRRNELSGVRLSGL